MIDNREFALLQVNWQNKYESYLVHFKLQLFNVNEIGLVFVLSVDL